MSEWRDIESAPKDGEDFLAICASNGFARVVFYDDSPAVGPSHCWTVADGCTYHKGLFTHWMPLPEPPRATDV